MNFRSAIAALKELAADPGHLYEPSLHSFNSIDLPRLKEQLKLRERGEENGERGEPPTGSSAFDDVEAEILDLIEREKTVSYQQLLDNFALYQDRLHALDIEGHISSLAAAAKNGLASFKLEISTGLDSLHALTEKLAGSRKDLQSFRERNKLDRSAHYPSVPKQIFLFGLLACLFLIETIVNGNFLSKGHEFGLIGGWGQAVVISILNIVIGAWVGYKAIPNMFSVHGGRKWLGYISLVLFLGFCFGFNLAVAHYREVASVEFEAAGRAAVMAIIDNPFGLAEIESWMLFGVGSAFAIGALFDGFSLDDRYPEYGKYDRIYQDSIESYRLERENIVDTFEVIKDETISAMEGAKQDVFKRRNEHKSILTAARRLHRSFGEHIDHLENAANSLLSFYRSANRASRSGNAPKRFNDKWEIKRPEVSDDLLPSSVSEEEIKQRAQGLERTIEELVNEVFSAFEEALQKIKSLDELAEVERGKTTQP